MSGILLTTAAEIAAALGGRREGRQWRCRCPIHGGRSLLVRDGDAGRILVFCHGGCETGDVLAELRRSGLLGGPSENYQLPTMRRNDCPDEAARMARALAVWRETRPATGTIVETYLANRGLALPPLQYLRFPPACPHPSGANLPGMIGLVEHENHRPAAIHRTFISAEGSGKAAVEPDKAALVPLPAAPCDWRMCARVNGCLLPKGWKRHSASCMPALCPGGQRYQQEGSKASCCHPLQNMVVICADNDANGVGQRAANAAAERFLAEGRRVRIALPPTSGLDFNDLLRGSTSVRIDENRHVA